jgi:DNA-binding MarR family transcriptional regulator
MEQMEKRYFDGVFIPSGLWVSQDLTWMEKILLAEIRSRQTGDWFSVGNGDLAESLGVSPPSISAYLARLYSKGYIEVKKVGEARLVRVTRECNILWYALQNPEGGVQNPEGVDSLSEQALDSDLFADALHNPGFRESKKERTKEKSISSNKNISNIDIYKSKNRASVTLEEVVAEYHGILPDLPRCIALTEKRRTMLRARCRETISLDGRTQDPGTLEFWQKFFRFVGESPFLTGKTMPSQGRKRFIADIDFLLSPQGFGRIIDGKYHRE